MFKRFAFVLIAIHLSSLNVNSESLKSSETSNRAKENDIKDERVIGGRDAFEGECPYQVALLANKRFTCGGFLIRPNAVVTAAHCVFDSPNEFTIRYNTLKYNSGPTIDVKKAIVHPYYNQRSNENDIAVLILNSTFVSDQNAKTIDISRALNPQTNSMVTVSGWGRTSPDSNAISDVLKVANLTIISRRTCSELWSPLVITSRMICAMQRTNSACNGDSGGPLVQNGNIVGIVSFGSRECLNSRLPNVYTRVSSYSSWINYAVKLYT